MTGKIESFCDLNVYKLAVEVQQEMFELTKKFPKEELYSLTDHETLVEKCRKIGGMLGEMMAEPQKWCARFSKK